MNWKDLGITTADIYDRESDSELDELLDEEYYPSSCDEESDLEEYTQKPLKKKFKFYKTCLIMTEVLHKLFYTNYESSDWSESDSEMSDDDDSTYYPSDSEDSMSLASEEEDICDYSGEESPAELSAVSTESESSESEPPSKYARIDFEIPEFEIESKGKI